MFSAALEAITPNCRCSGVPAADRAVALRSSGHYAGLDGRRCLEERVVEEATL